VNDTMYVSYHMCNWLELEILCPLHRIWIILKYCANHHTEKGEAVPHIQARAASITKLYSRRLKSKHNCIIYIYIYVADDGNNYMFRPVTGHHQVVRTTSQGIITH